MSSITLSSRETIVAVVPESTRGPGWANQLAWVYINNSGDIRRECVQSEDFTPAMWALFRPGAEMCKALKDAIEVIDADCCDISNCLVCGEPVVCVPDGMPMCNVCAEKEG